MSIILARKRLVQIADCAACPASVGRAIHRVIRENMYRLRHSTSPGSKMVHPMPSPTKVRAVRAYKKRHPKANDGDIGRMFNLVNHGRMSEVLYGKNGKPMYDKRGHRIP